MYDVYYDPRTGKLMVISEVNSAGDFVYWCETEHFFTLIYLTKPYWVKVGEL